MNGKSEDKTFGRYAEQHQIDNPLSVIELEVQKQVEMPINNVLHYTQQQYDATYPHDPYTFYQIQGSYKMYLGDHLYSNEHYKPQHYVSGTEDTFVVYFRDINQQMIVIQRFDTLADAYRAMLQYNKSHTHDPIKINMRDFISKYYNDEINIFKAVKGLLSHQYRDVPEYNQMIIHMSKIEAIALNNISTHRGKARMLDTILLNYLKGIGRPINGSATFNEIAIKLISLLYIQKYILNSTLDGLCDEVFEQLNIK